MLNENTRGAFIKCEYLIGVTCVNSMRYARVIAYATHYGTCTTYGRSNIRRLVRVRLVANFACQTVRPGYAIFQEQLFYSEGEQIFCWH